MKVLEAAASKLKNCVGGVNEKLATAEKILKMKCSCAREDLPRRFKDFEKKYREVN